MFQIKAAEKPETFMYQ